MKTLEDELKRKTSFLQDVKHRKYYNSNASQSKPTAVVFKVLKWHSDTTSTHETLDYIANGRDEEDKEVNNNYFTNRSDNLTLIDNNYLELTFEEAKEKMKDWNISNEVRKRTSGHILFSMPKHSVSENPLIESVQKTLEKHAEYNKYFLALHSENERLHVHVLIKNYDEYSKPLRINRSEISKIKDTFAYHLQSYGVNAISTHNKRKENQQSKFVENLEKRLPRFMKKWGYIYKLQLQEQDQANPQKPLVRTKIDKINNDKVNDFFNLYENPRTALLSFTDMYKGQSDKADPRYATWLLENKPTLFGKFKDENIIPIIDRKDIFNHFNSKPKAHNKDGQEYS